MSSQNDDRVGTPTSIQPPSGQPNHTDEDTNEVTTVPLHASCAHCKHFHRHKSFQLPKDGSDHQRFHCEVCDYPMVGLGRSETQTTLASEDSIILTKDGKPRQSPKAVCINRPPRIQTKLFPNAQPSDHLTPVVEKSPTAPNTDAEHRRCSASAIDGHQETYQQPDPVDLETGHSPKKWSLSHAWNRVRSVKSRFKNRLFRRQRRLGFGRHGVNVQFLPLSERSNSRQPAEPFEPFPERPAVSRHDTTNNSSPTSPPGFMRQTDALVVESGNLVGGTQEMSRSEICSSASDGAPAAYVEAPASKEERLRQFRRQKTLKRKALTHTVCECDKGCHCCSQHLPDPTDRLRIMSPQRNISTDAVPDYVLNRRPLTDPGSVTSFGPLHLPPDQLGQQFPTSLAYPPGFSSPISTDSDRSRDSQALTQVGSDASTSGSSQTMLETRPASSTGFRTTASRSLRRSGSSSVMDRHSYEEARRHSPLNQAETCLEDDLNTGQSSIVTSNTEDDVLQERRPRIA